MNNQKTVSRTTYHTLRAFIDELKVQACHYGRFPEGRISPEAFDTRYSWGRKAGFKPQRCGGYNAAVRRITALTLVLSGLDGKTLPRRVTITRECPACGITNRFPQTVCFECGTKID